MKDWAGRSVSPGGTPVPRSGAAPAGLTGLDDDHAPPRRQAVTPPVRKSTKKGPLAWRTQRPVPSTWSSSGVAAAGTPPRCAPPSSACGSS
ncbi:hypothetical protein FMEAI12_5190003 [Parafrankia sp. Ea1.12]|nr:hypothetical protein FMEAI12_5190003 [Parafrankia sp. Ea1.12]